MTYARGILARVSHTIMRLSRMVASAKPNHPGPAALYPIAEFAASRCLDADKMWDCGRVTARSRNIGVGV
jgi:hypothetical protein